MGGEKWCFPPSQTRMVHGGAVPLQMVRAVLASQLQAFHPEVLVRSPKACFLLLVDPQTTLTTEDRTCWLFPQPCLFLMGASRQTGVLRAAGQRDGIPLLVGPTSS